MSRFRTLALSASLLLGLLSPILPAAARAQEATPSAELGIPDPSECTVEPRPMDFFEPYFGGTPTAEQQAVAEATPNPEFQMPEGEPADEATIAEVRETVWQLGACINAGDFWGGYAAMYTEDYLQRQFELYGPIPEEERAFMAATPEPLPAESSVALLAIEEVRMLPDGRVAALFQIYDPFAAVPGPARFYWEFVEEDGRWLIDEEIMLGPIGVSEIGTPTA